MVADTVGSADVPFLDVCVSAVGSKVCFKPFAKPTKLRIPFCLESAHPKLYFCWPAAEVIMLARNSTFSFGYDVWRTDLTKILIEYGYPLRVVRKLLSESHADVLSRSRSGMSQVLKISTIVFLVPANSTKF